MCIERQNTLQQLIAELEKLTEIGRKQTGEVGDQTKAAPKSSLQQTDSQQEETQTENQK
jgi:hypothetical protein